MFILFMVLIGIFLYAFIASMLYNIGFEIGPFDTDDIFIPIFWPISIPIVLAILLAKKVVKLFFYKKEKK